MSNVLPEDAVVLRLLKASDHFFRDPDRKVPTPNAFAASSADKEEAAQRELDVGISLYERERTTPAQAVAIRQWFEVERGGSPGDYRVGAVSVEQMTEVVSEAGHSLSVHRDPIQSPPEAALLSGASGHCAAYGLYPKSKADRRKRSYRDMLAELAEELVLVPVE